jgi:ABC-type microcin C transport system permease subunit YejB
MPSSKVHVIVSRSKRVVFPLLSSFDFSHSFFFSYLDVAYRLIKDDLAVSISLSLGYMEAR